MGLFVICIHIHTPGLSPAPLHRHFTPPSYPMYPPTLAGLGEQQRWSLITCYLKHLALVREHLGYPAIALPSTVITVPWGSPAQALLSLVSGSLDSIWKVISISPLHMRPQAPPCIAVRVILDWEEISVKPDGVSRNKEATCIHGFWQKNGPNVTGVFVSMVSSLELLTPLGCYDSFTITKAAKGLVPACNNREALLDLKQVTH